MVENPKVNFFFEKEQRWANEIAVLRQTILSCGLHEDLKWGCPCYTNGKSNVVLIHTFKAYCAVLFFKGALIKEPGDLLIQQTENVQAARQMRFTSVDEVLERIDHLKHFVHEAITIEASGAKVEMKKTEDFECPVEFTAYLDQDSDLKAAFDRLTPGRKRQYLLHFSSPKQEKTRIARIEKCIPDIRNGKGLND